MALSLEQQKAVAARAAAALVEDGQVVGLGTGTTMVHLFAALAERVRAGLHLVGIPTSDATAQAATRHGLTLATLERYPHPDLDIDGADEVDPRLDLIKGRGGALLREKIVAFASRRLIIVADETKPVDRLGERASVPVEVVPFGWSVARASIVELGAQATLRGDATPFRTDNGNFILDCRFSDLSDPRATAAQLKRIPGVVEHGLFIGMTSLVLVGHSDGSVTRMDAVTINGSRS